ncbi:MAG TPA: response regulator [Peptococcaceae bacterium]|nr:response regulator [Peptococcaceae bacterium]
MKHCRIVVADSDHNSRKTIQVMLNRAGYDIAGEARDGLDAEQIIREVRPDLVIIDVFLPGRNGYDVARVVDNERIAAIILTSPSYESGLVEKACEVGAFSFLVKPIEEVQLLPAVELALSNFQELLRLEEAISQLRDKLETRKLIERAKGILMETMGLTEAEAYRRIQKQSMNKRISMRAVAEAIILSHELSHRD